MKRLEEFEELTRRAQREPAPTPDVSAAVRQRVDALRGGPVDSPALPLAFAAAACTVAAGVCGYLGLQAWSALTEPWLGSLLSVSAWWLL
jgi:hypothetical protein